MKIKHTCENCIWHDKCASEEPCDFYEPEELEDEIDVAAYEEDLRMRHKLYKKQEAFQNK